MASRSATPWASASSASGPGSGWPGASCRPGPGAGRTTRPWPAPCSRSWCGSGRCTRTSWPGPSPSPTPDPDRGYGPGMRRLLPRLGSGGDWRASARALYRGEGSLGNGAAMRVGPLGAWFADDEERAAVEARRSAEVTHAHPEGIAGAVAVAAAAALAARTDRRGADLVAGVIEFVPEGAVREGLRRARDLGAVPPEEAARLLGSGALASAPDTVPFALWCASRSPDDYEAALWLTLGGLGDRDTTCAIVGGIVAARVGREGIPSSWLAAREPLPPLPT